MKRITFDYAPLSSLGLLLLVAACSGGGGGGGGVGGPVGPPAGTASPPFLPGLLAIAAASGTVRIDWKLPGAGFEAALFQATSAVDVYSGAPVAEGLSGDDFLVSGLPDGVEHFFGLGVRAAGGSAYARSGVVLRAVPGAPIFVDAAVGAGGDGMTPASAFSDLSSGLLTAFANGGGNVWVRDGTYAAATLPLFAGVHVYGGFGATFDLAGRDPEGGGTVLNGVAGQRAFDVQGVAPAAVLDGLCIDGNGVATVGVDVADTDVELRSVTIESFADRGIRLRNTSTTDEVDVQIANCSSSFNGADGLSLNGAFDLRIDGSRFDANLQEGVDLDDLVALDGATATLEISGSRFFGNGAEGLDADLVAPVLPGPNGGFFDVTVRGSNFERNGEDGLLIDQDYELVPGWDGAIVVRECRARANAQAGVHLDADAPATLLVHRVLASGNGGDGVLVTSESDAGIAVISASVSAGNLGMGIHAMLGNKAIVATHCIVAGNFGGGMSSDFVESSAASSVAYLQPNPWTGTRLVGNVVVNDPFAGAFQLAPEAYAQVLSQVLETVTLNDATDVMLGAPVELGDDGVELVAAGIMGNVVTLNAAPAAFAAPGLLGAFGLGSGVDEDYNLPPGSPAEGQGLTPPGGPIVDAGVWGSPSAGEPGVGDDERERLFRVVGTAPPVALGISSMQTLEVSFSDVLDPASVVLGEVRAVTMSGTELAIGFVPMGDRIVIMPPGGGWGAEPFRIELHRGLRAQDGTGLSTPAVLALAAM